MAKQYSRLGQEPDDNENESGKFLSSNGKIFLVVIFLVAQAVLAYFFTSENYYNVSDWVNTDDDSRPSYYEISDVIVNPAETYGERYLLVSIGLELDSEESRAALDSNHAMIRDRINEVLSRQTVRDLNSVAGRDTLKTELGIMINDILGKNSVQNLFFTEYVMQ